MEGIQKAIRSAVEEQKMGSSSSSSSSSYYQNQGLSGALSSSDQSRLVVTRYPRQGISGLTCTKLCAVCFVVGIVFGFTLKRRVKRWASKILRRLKDD